MFVTFTNAVSVVRMVVIICMVATMKGGRPNTIIWFVLAVVVSPVVRYRTKCELGVVEFVVWGEMWATLKVSANDGDS